LVIKVKIVKEYVIYLLILCLYISCSNDKKIEYEKATYFIDLDSVKRENNFKTSDIFKKVNVIILEDHDYAVLGDITEMQICDGKIYILDAWKTSKLYVYDKATGKYLKQIGSRGQGPEEYLGIRGFCIDTVRKEIYLLDAGKHKIHKHNLETGKYIANVNIPDEIWYKYISFANDKLYFNVMHWDYQHNDSRIAEINFKTGEIKEYISGNKYNLGWNEPAYTGWNFFATPDKYAEQYMNVIFTIEPDTVRPYLTVKHKDWMTKNLLITTEEEIEMGTHHSIYTDAQSKAFHIHSYIEWGDYIYFEYRQKRYYPVLYNKKTGETRHYEEVINDLLVVGDKTIMPTEYLYTNSKAAYDYIKPMKWKWYKDPQLEFVQGLDKREELIKLLSDNEEHCVIFEYEFK
jgi:hypothetical protein